LNQVFSPHRHDCSCLAFRGRARAVHCLVIFFILCTPFDRLLHPLTTRRPSLHVPVPPVVSQPDSFLGYFLALNRSVLQYAIPQPDWCFLQLNISIYCRYAHANGQFFDPANVIFGQEGALRDCIERGGGTWGISTRAFVFHFKGATVHKRRLSLWSNQPPERGRGQIVQGDEASDNVRCRLRRVSHRILQRTYNTLSYLMQYRGSWRSALHSALVVMVQAVSGRQAVCASLAGTGCRWIAPRCMCDSV
jgi:hypothetical protein